MLVVNQSARNVWQKQGHPDRCFVVTPAEGKLVMVHYGEKGYYELKQNGEEISGEEAILQRDNNNASFGIIPAEAEAMLHCSIWGFHNYEKMVALFKKN